MPLVELPHVYNMDGTNNIRKKNTLNTTTEHRKNTENIEIKTETTSKTHNLKEILKAKKKLDGAVSNERC